MDDDRLGEHRAANAAPATTTVTATDSTSATTTTATATTAATGNTKWDMMYMRLVEYKKKHNDCLVPNRYKPDPTLGSWVSTQRRHYKLLQSGKESSLTKERLDLLIKIDFVWATRDPRHVPWDQRYQELLNFKEKHGHCLVPVGYEKNVQLANWVSSQRQEGKLYKLKRQSRLTNERIKLLNDAGFVWEAQRGGARKRKNDERTSEITGSPTTKIPAVNADTTTTTAGITTTIKKTKTRERGTQKLSESGSKRPWIAMFKDYLWLLDQDKNPEDVPTLKQWANDQREEYKRENIQEGESSKLTFDQFNLLQSINFDWNITDSAAVDLESACACGVVAKSVVPNDDTRKDENVRDSSSCFRNTSHHNSKIDSSNSDCQKHHTQNYPNSTKLLQNSDSTDDTPIEVDAAEALFSLSSKP